MAGPVAARRRRVTRSIATIATARFPTSPRRPVSASRCTAWAWPPRTTTTTGALDVYLTGLGGNRLFRGSGGGKFVDVTATAGVAASGFSTSAAWLDYDRDGQLDLFVARYVQWSVEKDLHCTLDGKTKSYCTPESYNGESPHPVSQPRQRDVRGRHARGRPARSGVQGAGRGADRLRQRRPRRSLRRQRHAAESALPQSRQRHVYRCRDHGGRGVQRGRRGARGHGRRCRRLRRVRPREPRDRQLLERDDGALHERGQRPVHRRGADLHHRPDLAPVAHLRLLLLRLRPRRPARHLRRQRSRGRRHPGGADERVVRAGAAPVPQSWQPPLRGRDRSRWVTAFQVRARSRAARRTATSTTTATSTSSSPPTTAPRACCATTARGTARCASTLRGVGSNRDAIGARVTRHPGRRHAAVADGEDRIELPVAERAAADVRPRRVRRATRCGSRVARWKGRESQRDERERDDHDRRGPRHRLARRR